MIERFKASGSLSSPAFLFAEHAAPCRKALGRMLPPHSASCGAPIRQDCIETSAKSEVVTVCSWQFAGEERLQSPAMILITTAEPRRCDGCWRR